MIITVGSKVKLVNDKFSVSDLKQNFGLSGHELTSVIAGRPATVIVVVPEQGRVPDAWDYEIAFQEWDDYPAINDSYAVSKDEIEEIPENL